MVLHDRVFDGDFRSIVDSNWQVCLEKFEPPESPAGDVGLGAQLRDPACDNSMHVSIPHAFTQAYTHVHTHGCAHVYTHAAGPICLRQEYAHVHMHAYAHVYTHVCANAYTHVHTHACAYVHTHVCMHACTRFYSHARVYVYVLVRHTQAYFSACC